MPDREPVELTIKKLEMAWEMIMKAGRLDGRPDTVPDRLEGLRAAYKHISETVEQVAGRGD